MCNEKVTLSTFIYSVSGWKHFVLPREYSDEHGGLRVLLLYNEVNEDKRFIYFYIGWDGSGTAVVNRLEEDGSYSLLQTIQVLSEEVDVKSWLMQLGAWPLNWLAENEAARLYS
ncbi:MAG: hypothetical protein EOP04_13970 [Proteobacteria bacterium]|nr:MAG: hypothetical protein EOP04_13970 [Pseudomonadota bacterium]